MNRLRAMRIVYFVSAFCVLVGILLIVLAALAGAQGTPPAVQPTNGLLHVSSSFSTTNSPLTANALLLSPNLQFAFLFSPTTLSTLGLKDQRILQQISFSFSPTSSSSSPFLSLSEHGTLSVQTLSPESEIVTLWSNNLFINEIDASDLIFRCR